MLKQIKIGFMVVLAMVAFASCQNANNDVREAARESVEGVQPANPAATPEAAAAGPTTTMTFEETEFSFGTITDGDKVSHTYTFTNTGSEPLILSDARGSCGCTVPSWPREPIAPGAKGEITVEFNSANKVGARNQKVTITANTTPPQSFIYLKGDVLAKDAPAN
jgi:hypothetical protein